ncbi:hypothetical protein P3T76_005416 [Phytophthora citrophthora]|uniref:Uncharacterized protein n=1 Tax=Phytophthora citrophthora TaxID=4793 RepID=A0AAD9GPU7_9STRA|nr:hypothetical protein P3T76_005416 [Phytophthora citrophthora]
MMKEEGLKRIEWISNHGDDCQEKFLRQNMATPDLPFFTKKKKKHLRCLFELLMSHHSVVVKEDVDLPSTICEFAANMDARLVWFQLVDVEGNNWGTADRVKGLSDEDLVVDLQNALKVMLRDNVLAGISPSDLNIFANWEAFDENRPLNPSSSLRGLGMEDADNLLILHPVIVQMPGGVYDQSVTGNRRYQQFKMSLPNDSCWHLLKLSWKRSPNRLNSVKPVEGETVMVSPVAKVSKYGPINQRVVNLNCLRLDSHLRICWRSVWFEVVDIKGNMILENHVDELSDKSSIGDFRDALRARFSDDLPAGLSPMEIVFFENRMAYDAKVPLALRSLLGDLGQNDSNALIVQGNACWDLWVAKLPNSGYHARTLANHLFNKLQQRQENMKKIESRESLESIESIQIAESDGSINSIDDFYVMV